MMKNLLFLLLALFIFSCGGGSSNSKEEESEKTEEIAQVEAPSDGKIAYTKYCRSCHQVNGTGSPGLYPPLTNTEWVTGDKERLIGIVINGLTGSIEVNGEQYDNVMPPMPYMSDQEIAEVLTYVRSNFGNSASEVTVAEVEKVRASK